MHRLKLLKLLEQYTPHSQEENATKEKIIVFINENYNCFDRKLETGHITGSAWLLNKQADKALLMHHAKLNIWVQPGGHADGDSDILSVAIREAQEESGIKDIEAVDTNIFDIDIHLIPENSKEKSHYHYDIRFLLQAKNNEELCLNDEAKELKWVDQNEITILTNQQSIIRMYNKSLHMMPTINGNSFASNKT